MRLKRDEERKMDETFKPHITSKTFSLISFFGNFHDGIFCRVWLDFPLVPSSHPVSSFKQKHLESKLFRNVAIFFGKTFDKCTNGFSFCVSFAKIYPKLSNSSEYTFKYPD